MRSFQVVTVEPPNRPLVPVDFASTSRLARSARSGPKKMRNSSFGATDGMALSPMKSPPMKTCAVPGSSWNALPLVMSPRRKTLSEMIGAATNVYLVSGSKLPIRVRCFLEESEGRVTARGISKETAVPVSWTAAEAEISSSALRAAFDANPPVPGSPAAGAPVVMASNIGAGAATAATGAPGVIGGGTNTSTNHGSTSGGLEARVGWAVESESLTSFQSSPVRCATSASYSTVTAPRSPAARTA